MLDPQSFIILYITLYVFFCLLLIYSFQVKLRAKKTIAVLFILLISISCGLRSQYVGTDTYTFYNLTKAMVSADSFFSSKDYFYYMLTRLGFSFGGYQLSVFLPALVTSLFLAISVLRITQLSFIGTGGRKYQFTETLSVIFIFVLLISSSDFLMQIINQTRQVLSLSIFLYALPLYFNKKYIQFFLFCVLGTYSHHSLVIVIFSLVIVHWIKSDKFYMAFFFACCLLGVSGLAAHALDFLGIGVSEGSIYYKALNSAASLYSKTVITVALGFLAFYLAKKIRLESCSIEVILLRIYFMLSSVSMLYISFAEASNRIQRYEGVIYPFIFILIIRRFKINAYHVVAILAFSIAYFAFMMSYYSTLKTLGFYSIGMKPL